MKKIWNYRPFIILVLATVMMIVFSFVFKSQDAIIKIGEPSSLNESWRLDDNPNHDLTLPVNLDIEPKTTYTIRKVLDNNFQNSQTLLIRTSLQNVIVRLDGEIIYKRIYQEEKTLPPFASMWHFIDLPQNSNGVEISISFDSPYPQMSGIINEISYGTNASLYASLFRTYGYRLFLSIFVFFVGFVMMIISLFFFQSQNKKYTYLGLSAILISLWMLAESRLIQWMIGSEFIIGSLAYFSLVLIPVPLLYYFKDYIMKIYKKPFWAWIIVLYAFCISILALHYFGVMDFFESVIITQILIVGAFITSTTLLIIEVKKHYNLDAKNPLKLLALLMVFFIFELINFVFNNFRDTSVFINFGITLVVFIILLNYFKFLVERLKLAYQKEIYQQLAYTDRLTQGNNRLSFEEDFERFFLNSESRNLLRLIYFDFDDLKRINDEYGHLEGDKVIEIGYYTINQVFKDYGKCYRIGGDEFSCLTTDMNDETFADKVKLLDKEIKKINKDLPYQFNISIGTSIYDPNRDHKPSDMIQRADYEMYLNKGKKVYRNRSR